MTKFGGWAAVKDGSIVMNDKVMVLPGLKLIKEAGRGANAVVFEAIDELLNRPVAVKVWNTRGVERAQLETAKIAQLNHPLIVSTYQFGWIDDHPFSVMEFVPGSSGKSWLKEKPSIAARTLVWQLFSRALRFIHTGGGIHGDPHLGNILIFPDREGIYGHETPFREQGLSIKLADTGTSEFWSSREAILSRESRLIFETAGRLFKDLNFDKLWFHPLGLSHQHTLELLDVLCEYASLVYGWADYDRRSENAGKLADLVIKTPLFDLDEVVSQINEAEFTTTNRFARRLNQRLYKIRDVMAASDIIGAETREFYDLARQKFLDAQKRRATLFNHA